MIDKMKDEENKPKDGKTLLNIDLRDFPELYKYRIPSSQ